MNLTNSSTFPISIRHLDVSSTSNLLLGIVFDENATASQLSIVVLAFAIAWFLIFYVVKSIIRPCVHNRPWLLQALEKDYERSGKHMIKDLKIKMTKDEALAWSMNDFPRMQCIYIQHFVGSLFCIPSLFGLGDPSFTSSLAICGVLSEIGWEVQDMAEIFYVRTFCKNGKAIWPTMIVIVFLLHHSLTTFLGVPMILHYRHSRTLHWLCFDLQFAGAASLVVIEYTKLLDLSKPESLRQFKVLNLFALVTMVWTRVIHWAYLCFDMYVTWWQDGAFWFLSIGVPLSMLFFAFSYFCAIKPFYKKFVKFMHVSAEHQTLPHDAAPEKRRASVIKLDGAVTELLAGDAMAEQLADIVEQTFVKRRPSRRQSVPVLSRRRRSLVILHSKSFSHQS